MIAILALAAAVSAPAADAARKSPTIAIPAARYRVIRSGPANGAHPTRTSGVRVRYTGRFPGGATFDSSVGKADGTAIFPLRGLIPGFQAALLLMRPGDVWTVTIPPELAYGSVGHRLSGKTLEFDIELVEHAELPPVQPPTMTELPKP